jgi:opacity protein-like surface antigen
VRDGWSGLYIGIGGGASRVDHSSSVHTDVTKDKERCSKYKFNPYTGYCHGGWQDVYGYPKEIFDFTSLFGGEDTEGFGTVQVGYDHLFHNHLLIGAFVDVDIYGSGENDHNGKYFGGNFGLNHTWNLGARLGALVTPKVLLYGVGGYTQAGIDNSIHVPFGPKLEDFDDAKGWFVGGGGEVKLRPGLSLKLEYRYADYDSFSDQGSKTWGPFYDLKDCDWYRKTYTVNSKADDDLTVQSVRALLVFRLDEPDKPVALK